MSFFSRWLRKAPPSSPASAPQPAPSSPKPSAAERAQASAAEERMLQTAIAAGDAQAVARWVVEGSSTAVRQTAAQAIEDPELLQKLIRDMRGGKDNRVYKILSAKREVQLEQARKQERLQAEITATLQELERHSRLPHDALYSATLHVMERDWQAIAEHADPSLREQAALSLARARETVAAHARQLAEQAAREQAEAVAVAESHRQREQQAQAAAAAAAEQAQAIEAEQRAHEEQLKAEKQAARAISELIAKARAALREGNTARAAGVRRALDEHLAGATPPAALAGQIQQLDQQLRELQDWKQFSVAPKRVELIEQMQALIGATLEPPLLAEKIKALQDAWRALSRGAGENLEAEWQRFHTAAQQAYQPCAEYFAAQALIRQENLQRRAALLTKLEAFEAATHSESPDWRAVARALREAKPEWYRHAPVDRQAGRVQQQAFATVIERLQSLLDAEYARNRQQKESLIARAQALLASDDERQATAAVKALQQQWQAVGPVPHEADQRLWADFRQHCDAVFQKRQQTAAALAAGLEHAKTQAIGLCEQVEHIGMLEGSELLTRTASLAELRTAFEALGEFPRAESRELRQRFERALDRCKAALTRQHARDAERAWDHLFAAADPVRAYRLAVARGQDAETIERLKTAAESALAAVPRWPRGGQEALNQALAQSPGADIAANETALRILCIRAELMVDAETPAEDLALRRDYQLQRLARRMGQGATPDDTRFDTLALDWVRVGPVEAAVYQSLVQRFRRCSQVPVRPT